jgi:LacI family transcriptional regulator, galactose operon repressor
MTSIRQVAKLARVSTATVSNTINKPGIVLPATRDRVNEAIETLGFIPNQHARQLNGVSSQVLGLIVIDASNPFFTEVARAIEEAASETEHVIILCNSGGSAEKEKHFMRLLAGQRVRGILLTPSDSAELDPTWHGVPVVLLDHSADADGCSVSVDDIQGGRLAVEHLLDLGHRRLAFVGGSDSIRQHADRFEGARSAIRGRGLDPDAVLTRVVTNAIDIAAGVTAVDELADGANRPSAIFCANDVLAFGVYRGLAQRGISVPGDVSIMGYDDIDVAADWIVPLTSVRQPTAQIGTIATKLLLDHSSGSSRHTHEQVVFQPTLVARQSTAPPTSDHR